MSVIYKSEDGWRSRLHDEWIAIDRHRAAREAMDDDEEAERDDEDWHRQQYEDRIDGDWRMDADVRRAEAGYLGGRGR